jgi:beta-glucosidase
MKLTFPKDFLFGTSTSACQIETAFDHDWKGIQARDGHIFDRTTDHEKRYDEDVDIVSGLSPNYRMGVMWSRLQRQPYAALDQTTKEEYHQLLTALKKKGLSIMMVLHHFANPTWFASAGGWAKKKNIAAWVDFARKVVDEYGDYVSTWNTFNEPNLYVTLGFGVGKFPPFRKNIVTAVRVIRNIGQAHDIMYDYIKSKYPGSMVGFSHNCAVFTAENLIGTLPAKFSDWWFMRFLPGHFKKFDFFGMSYYAKISYDPAPITYLFTPEKLTRLGKDHDDLWEYHPEGLRACMERYWKKFRKPIIITENGFCTNDDSKRESSIKDYMKVIHKAIEDGIEVRGYYHWTPWDNFEWTLGPSFRFGLYECDFETKERRKKPSAVLYSSIAHSREVEL